jgi:farnesyl diphosphate synthase
MPFSQRLAHAAALVETRLAELFDGMAAAGTPARLLDAMRHAALGGGKRVRPFLLIECAALFGVQASAARSAAAALECVHCYSLVHDDLPAMDDDDLRRGRPTVHKAFDEWTAILAGDALLTVAFELLASPDTHADAAVRAELALGLARASGAAGMVGGSPDLGRPSASRRGQRLPTCSAWAMKTESPYPLRLQAGAIPGGANNARALPSTAIGRAFQIADDLLTSKARRQPLARRLARTPASTLWCHHECGRRAELAAKPMPCRPAAFARADSRGTAAFVVRRQA